MDKKNKEYYSIDLMHIVKSVWRRAWSIAAIGVLTALIGMFLAAFIISPTYESSVELYVNNSSNTQGTPNSSVSSSEITAAQSLAKTYRVILNNHQTLEEVIEKTGVKYSCKQLKEMIDAVPADDTEIIRVTVTADNPDTAAQIANGIAEVLPDRVADIVNGASMSVVGWAVPNDEKVGPSLLTFTLVGFILGAFATCAVLVVLALMDNTIHDEDYVIKNYDCPILAKVPDLVNSGNKRYGYYYKSKKGNND